MKTGKKKMIAAGCAGVLVVLGAAAVSNGYVYGNGNEKTVMAQSGAEIVQKMQAQPADLTFWYADASYGQYFEKAAEAYYADTGIKVDVKYQDVFHYMNRIYDATMQNTDFPDAYLIGSDELENAYLYGLAAENTAVSAYEGSVAEKALEAASCQDKMYGYPLSYRTCLFVYQNGYFQTQPASIQAVIDDSKDMEQPEHVQYLLEWDVNDAFFDFPFIANSVSFEKNETGAMQVSYDEQLYEQDLEFFARILESFSIDASSVTGDSVVEDFRQGKTICAIISSDSLSELEGADYSVMEMLPLNDTLPAYSAALTDLVVVNDFSEKKEQAADFAQYVTLVMSERLHDMEGKYSVKLQEGADEKEKTAYRAYENSIIVPDSQDAEEFWVTLKETISQYF